MFNGACRALLFFFFSSRRRHTRLQGDWSSDACSSDLRAAGPDGLESRRAPPTQTRTAVARSTMLSTFARDHFICRYSHCRKRTIYIPVLRELSALFPDVIPYDNNWRPLVSHILY